MAKQLPAEEFDLPGETGETVPGTDVLRAILDPRSPRKFATADGPGRRIWSQVIIRQAGTYRVFVEAPDGKQYKVGRAVIVKPDEKRKVSLRVMVDAIDIPEVPEKPEGVGGAE